MTTHLTNKVTLQQSVVIVDFMSVVRKVPFAKCSTFKAALAFVWHLVTTAVSAGRVDIVYDSYLEGSIKESERRRRSPVDAVEVVNMKLTFDTTCAQCSTMSVKESPNFVK